MAAADTADDFAAGLKLHIDNSMPIRFVVLAAGSHPVHVARPVIYTPTPNRVAYASRFRLFTNIVMHVGGIVDGPTES
jgi:hypothetical protein